MDRSTSTAAGTAISDAGLKLTTNLLSRLVPDNNCHADKDVLISPLGVQLALALALEGAAEQTAAQLRLAVGYGADASQEQVHADMASLATALRDGEAQLAVANALWVDSKLPIDPAFIARAAELVAKARNVDFAQGDAVRSRINGWVAEKTNHKINHLLGAGSVTPDTRLIVTNAIHFKAVWQHKFKHQNTNAAPFHTLGGGGELQVQMMRQSANLAHASFKTHAAVSLPYKDSRLQMLIMLPHDNSAEALLNVHASLVGLREQHEQLSVKPVALALPRFKINAEFELSSVLQSLGVTDPFGMSADFSALTTTDAAGKDLRIDQVIHKTFIKVDEVGTEAAAATAVVVKRKRRAARSEEQFVVDRPFVFAIYHTQLHCPVFVGQVARPNTRTQ